MKQIPFGSPPPYPPPPGWPPPGAVTPADLPPGYVPSGLGLRTGRVRAMAALLIGIPLLVILLLSQL